MLSGLYSSKFVTRFSLIFQKKNRKGGGGQKRAKFFQSPMFQNAKIVEILVFANAPAKTWKN